MQFEQDRLYMRTSVLVLLNRDHIMDCTREATRVAVMYIQVDVWTIMGKHDTQFRRPW